MEIETTDFEFIHGRRPRGYGFWSFIIVFQPKGVNRVSAQRFHACGLYGEARKEARAMARTISGTVLGIKVEA